MSRSAAARTQHQQERALRRPLPHGAAHARRMSGPAHPAARPPNAHPASGQAHAYAPAPAYHHPRPRPASRPPLRLAAGGAAIALRVADSAVNVSASRTMDRLVRSRAWVVIIGVGLIGIVAMQVSMLKLNSGIGRAVDKVATLERTNASLKAEVSELTAGDRIQTLAGARGFVMPEPADVTYLRAGDKRSDGLRAARRMRAPNPAIAGPAGAVSAAKAPPSLTGADTTASAGATGAAATTATGATTPAAANGVAQAQGPPATANATANANATSPVTATPQSATPAPAAASTAQTSAPTATATGTGSATGPSGATAPAPQTTATGGVTTP